MLTAFWVLGLITKAHYSCANYLAHTTQPLQIMHILTNGNGITWWQWPRQHLEVSCSVWHHRIPPVVLWVARCCPNGPDLLTQTRLTTWALTFLGQFLSSYGSLSGHTVLHPLQYRYMWEGCTWAASVYGLVMHVTQHPHECHNPNISQPNTAVTCHSFHLSVVLKLWLISVYISVIFTLTGALTLRGKKCMPKFGVNSFTQ